MNNPAKTSELARLQTTGVLVFVFLCGMPALELNGFGFGIPLSLEYALGCATLGGAVGGAMICSKPLAAGLFGGLLAGPVGLIAVYFYTQNRQMVTNYELVLVQGIGSLPGVGLGVMIKKLLAGLSLEETAASQR